MHESTSFKHFVKLSDWEHHELMSIIELADEMKSKNFREPIGRDKVLGLLFFNPSLRTKVSFEAAAGHLGCTATVIAPGQGSWSLETRKGVVMDGNKTEHIKEAIQVLSQYCDAIGVRAFSTLTDKKADFEEEILHQVLEYSEVPVINLESAMDHPCQAMADWMTIRELYGKKLDNRKIVLTWAPHPYALPMAVPLSVLDMSCRAGLQVTLSCPPEMLPDDLYMQKLHQTALDHGTSLTISHSQQQGFKNADIVYAKSWASPIVYEDPVLEKKLRTESYHDWTVTREKMSICPNARFMHCLPVRRNVVVNDDVLDSNSAVHIQQAGNRLHVQKSILRHIWNI